LDERARADAPLQGFELLATLPVQRKRRSGETLTGFPYLSEHNRSA